DVPGDRPAEVARPGEKLLGEDLKQRFFLDGSDGKLALGAVVPQACTLSTGDEKSSDFAFAEELVSPRFGIGVEFLPRWIREARIRSDRLDFLWQRDGGLVLDVVAGQLLEVFEVKSLKLRKQFFLRGRGQLIPKAEDVGLGSRGKFL